MRLTLPNIGLYNLSSLKSYWNFDSDYTDQVGSNDLTASATGVSRTAGRTEFSNAATFADGYLTNSSMSSVPSGDNDITINFWYQHTALTDQNILMYLGTSATSGGIGFRFDTGELSGVVDNTSYTLTGTTSNLNLNDWCMLTATYDASESEAKFYYNGVLVSTQSVSNRNFQQSLIIGAFTTSDGNPILSNGQIDETSIFNEVLTGNQIRQLYSHPGLGGFINNDNINLLWRFENDYLDDSDNFHNGHISIGAMSVGLTNGKVGGKALSLDGTGYVYADLNGDPAGIGESDLDVSGSDFTAVAWFYYESTVPGMGGSGNAAGIIGKIDPLAEMGWQFLVLDGATIKLRVILAYGPMTAYAIGGTATLSTDTWYRVGITREGQVVKFYINGKLDKTDNQANNALSFSVPTANMSVGYNAYNNDYLEGKIDDVIFIKGEAWDQKQFQKDYTQSLGRYKCN